MIKNFKNNTVTDSLASGAAAIALIAGVGIAATPAQAGSLGFSDGADPFFDSFFAEVDPNDPDTLPESFSVTFSPDSIALISTANGEFLPEFDPGAPPPFGDSVNPVTANFDFVRDLGLVDGIVAEFEYELDGDLTFDFGNGVTVTYGDGSIFQGELDVAVNGTPIIEGVEFEGIELAGLQVTTLDGTFTVGGDPNFITGAGIVFEDIAGEPAPTYGASVSVSGTRVPEPTTILSLLAVGGLGVGLKRRKQSKQLPA